MRLGQIKNQAYIRAYTVVQIFKKVNYSFLFFLSLSDSLVVYL